MRMGCRLHEAHHTYASVQMASDTEGEPVVAGGESEPDQTLR